jgi:hypothetical protein
MNLGFIVPNLANSDMAYELLKFVNPMSESRNDINVSIFTQNIIPPVIQPTCLTMNISGLSGFKGKVVAIGLDSADILYKNNSNTDNYILFWDLNWLYGVINYEVCIDLLKNFKIIARSESHKQAIRNFTGRTDVTVIDSFEDLLPCLNLKK